MSFFNYNSRLETTFILFIPAVVLLNITFMLILSERAVQAQSLKITHAAVAEAEMATAYQPIQRNMTLTVAQSDAAHPSEQDQPRPLQNYVGIGGSIGISGKRTGLSESGAAIITKNDLNDLLSIRGVSVFGRDRSDNTFALTVNFPVRSRSGQVQLVPFVGGGLLLSSKYNFDDFIVRGLVTSGIDVPLSRRITATSAVNVGFTDKTNIGVQLGIAYNF